MIFIISYEQRGYDDVERGERGSSEEHLTVTQFKVEQEKRQNLPGEKGQTTSCRDCESPALGVSRLS